MVCSIEKTNMVTQFRCLDMGLRKDPGYASQRVNCGKGEQDCPQHIPIREKLVEADKQLRPFRYKVGINVARKYVMKERK